MGRNDGWSWEWRRWMSSRIGSNKTAKLRMSKVTPPLRCKAQRPQSRRSMGRACTISPTVALGTITCSQSNRNSHLDKTRSTIVQSRRPRSSSESYRWLYRLQRDFPVSSWTSNTVTRTKPRQSLPDLFQLRWVSLLLSFSAVVM